MSLSRVKVWGAERLYASDLNAEFNNIINNAASLISPLSAGLDWDGFAQTLDAAGVTTAQSTAAVAWSFTPGSKTGTPGTTGSISNWAANTVTDNNTAGSGTAAIWTGHAFHRPTLAAANALVTTTNAATVYIENSPLAGSNETITNAWSLWIDDGPVRFDGALTVNAAATITGTLTAPAATDTVPGLAEVATQAEVNAMTDTSRSLTANHNKLVLGAYTASTSGTEVLFGSIPAGVRRITVNLVGVSTGGTNDYLIQIGDSGGIETSGYLGAGATIVNASNPAVSNSTAGFVINQGPAAAGIYHGSAILTLVDSATFMWACQSTLARSDSTSVHVGAGRKATSAELTQLRVYAAGDSFDAGAVNITYER